jgi:exosortase E/protease (VPEID-CTERM system)
VNSTLAKNVPVQTGLVALRTAGILPRVLLLGSLCGLELIPLSLIRGRGLSGSWVAEWLVAFAVLLLAFGYKSAQGSYRSLISTQLVQPLAGWRYLAGHICAMLAFLGLFTLRFPMGTAHLESFFLAGALWGLALLAVILAIFAFFPPTLFFLLVRGMGSAACYAAVGATVAMELASLREWLWDHATRSTFAIVEWLLRQVVSGVVADPDTFTIGTPRFQVEVGARCSGIAGIGLMLVFLILWLWFFRKEFRFPQALLLVPAGLLAVWLMNLVRITALILIGHAGARDVAVYGFHSQAGWIAVSFLTLGFAYSAQRWSWVAVRNTDRPLEDKLVEPVENLTAAYLMPLLMILAAAMISRAASGGFESLYPLRFFAAVAALWFFRSTYASLDWHFGWLAPITGAVVFVMWLGLESFSGAHTDNGIAAGLASWPPLARVAWLTLRVLAAVVTVPIAEELAFRGYLIRRLISSHFESVDPTTWTYFSVLASSIVFGLPHGDRWLAGIAAGILYAVVFLVRGRIGDAVVAHATTNALLAIWVLARGAWYMW